MQQKQRNLMATPKRAERTERKFWYLICRLAIDQCKTTSSIYWIALSRAQKPNRIALQQNNFRHVSLNSRAEITILFCFVFTKAVFYNVNVLRGSSQIHFYFATLLSRIISNIICLIKPRG